MRCCGVYGQNEAMTSAFEIVCIACMGMKRKGVRMMIQMFLLDLVMII